MLKKERKAILQVNSSAVNGAVINFNHDCELTADIEGTTRLDRLILVDQKTGVEWELIIKNGSIIVEPFDVIEKRDFKIDKIIHEKS